MTEPTSQIVVGRQAIQDRDGQIVGFELLFRRAAGESGGLTGDQMTAEVLFGALNIGLNHVVGGKLIFCNAARGVLLGDVPITLPAEQTVVEVLETVEPDDAILAGCARLVEQGYTLALDDFEWIDGAPALLELATIVKIDIQVVQGDALDELIEQCRPFDVRLLAEKIETEDELNRFLDMGFDLFQGYQLERPVLVSGRTVEPSAISRIRLAATLLSTELSFDEIDTLLRSDPALAYQVMQIASLGRAGETRRSIYTIRDALVLAGSRRVQNWIALLLARPVRDADQADFTKTLIRARACELLAGKISSWQASMGFAAGLLSSLDLLFGIPPAELRASLPIGGLLAEAAFGDETELARVVRDAVDYQLSVPGRKRQSQLTEHDLDDAFAQAFVWTMETSTALDS